MATHSILKSSLLRAVANRSYSSQATVPVSGIICDIKTTVLPNKLVVASAENGSPIARISIVLRAGSRYETPDSQGAAHVLRIAAGLSTKNFTNFAITRNIQQVGANLTCTTDRETISYTLEGTYDAVEQCSKYLSDIVSKQVFKPWEISDSMPRLRLELASLTPQAKALNFLHRVAYRDGLGNSLYCAKHNVGKVSTETLQHYVCNNFTTNRAAIVGIGINHEQLVGYAQNMGLDSGAGSADSKAKYHGGEVRSEKGGNSAIVTLATEGGSLSNAKEALAFQVLQRVYGVGPHTRYGNESAGILSKAVAKSGVAITALNANYSDSGLFGLAVTGATENIHDAVLSAAKALRSGNLSAEDIRRGKNQLKAAVLMNSESGGDFIETMGQQAVIQCNVLTADQLVQAVDAVADSDVQSAAQKVAKGKLSMASVGNLKCVPYLDELK